jgi:Xaa-Pro aminopeptidase
MNDSRLADEALYAALLREGPMNLPRAIAVMERKGLDGLVLGRPVNVFHGLGHWPQIARTRVDQPPGMFAILAREHPDEWGLVTSRFLYYYTWADGRSRGDVQPWLYGALGDAGDFAPEPDFPLCPDAGGAPLSLLEAHRADALARAGQQRSGLRDAGGALVSAMKGMGLWRGSIGFDDPVIAAVMARHEHPGEAVPADNILRNIRLIKSPLEQALMARAAEANAQALIAAAKVARAGARHCDLQTLFRTEAARRGNTSVFLNVDRVSSDLSLAELADGQTLFLDGVSHFLNYHGDFARTVFIGDPPASARRAVEASGLGWQAVREKLRPGLRYSEIVEIGTKAVRGAGYEANIGFGPHSVGLAHTDEPGEDHGGFWRKPDLMLEEGMVISVDCPVLDTGIGGSAHCEDLMLITSDGARCIHSEHETVIVI